MDWSNIDTQYIHTLEFVTYWLLIALWTALPFCGIVVLVYAAFKWGQSMKPSVRKNARMEKELQQMLKENSNGR